MAGFFYFIPGERRENIHLAIKNSNLKEYSGRVASQGFCNLDGGGHIFSVRGKDKDVNLMILPEGQRIIDCDGYKIIYSLSNRPKPEDFLKKDAITGNMVELNDGNEWMVPMARHFEEGSQLPSALVVSTSDPSGYSRQPIERFLGLSEIAERAVEDCLISMGQLDAERNYTQIDEVFKCCFQILSTNYDITEEEISILELITDHNYTKVTQALIDWDSVKSALLNEVTQKKTLEILKRNLDYVNL